MEIGKPQKQIEVIPADIPIKRETPQSIPSKPAPVKRRERETEDA